jgi:hypothetical protein
MVVAIAACAMFETGYTQLIMDTSLYVVTSLTLKEYD